MSFHVDERCTWDWLLTDDDTSSLSKSLVDTSNDIIWCLDLAQENWFLESWRSSKLTSVDDSSCSWDDLTTSSVNGICVECTSKMSTLTPLMCSSQRTPSLVAHWKAASTESL